MTTPLAPPWRFRIDEAVEIWGGRRLRLQVTLFNLSPASSIPEPRRLKPTLRDVHNHALATSDVYRPDLAGLTVFRPVVPPGGSVEVCLQFERLPPDRVPDFLTFGEPDLWSVVLPVADSILQETSA